MKILLFLLLSFSLSAQVIDDDGPQSGPGTLIIHGITYFGSASNPADNGTNTTSPIVITPPASMVAGDLVYVHAMVSATDRTIDMSAAGGQTWTSEAYGNNNVHRIFWCQFDGTWDTDPSIAISGTGAKQAVMHVFRPTVGTNTWAVDVGPTYSTLAPSITPTIVDGTTGQKSTVTIGVWSYGGTNVYSSTMGTGWSLLGSSQYRNTSSGSNTTSYAYNIQSRRATLNNVQKTQSAGSQANRVGVITFYEH